MRIRILLLRLWYKLTGNCISYTPVRVGKDRNGIDQYVCRICDTGLWDKKGWKL